MMGTRECATHSSCEVWKRLGTADYIVYKIILIISCDLEWCVCVWRGKLVSIYFNENFGNRISGIKYICISHPDIALVLEMPLEIFFV